MTQIRRGVGRLPHVGAHPGTGLVLVMIAISALVGGREGGLIGVIGGGLIMGLAMGPIYLYGAYDRARLSDKLEGQLRKPYAGDRRCSH
ncbi:MAG: hypothetical protein ABJN42_03510 [Roseibium sp.]|uniref:hypothetical protein n=1 Tax=Roseibium sp. TaxID=1936156 RepID=UPI003298D5B7